jgi:hypothetical protein
MRFSYVQAHKWPVTPDLAQYRAVLGCRILTQRGPPVHFGARLIGKTEARLHPEITHGNATTGSEINFAKILDDPACCR